MAMKWMENIGMKEYLFNPQLKSMNYNKMNTNVGMVMRMINMQQLIMEMMPKPLRISMMVKIGVLLRGPPRDPFRR
jgi:hypothetical protein